MKSLKPYFTFTASQRGGLIVFFILIAAMQFALYSIGTAAPYKPSAESRQWLALQPKIDRLKLQQAETRAKIYPFNPNFISDFKGYRLGMSTVQIDRLLAFRKTGKYVNSAKEFQAVTKIPDSLLAAISPYFKFPDWVNNRRQTAEGARQFRTRKQFAKKAGIARKDINAATADDLVAVYGIGPALSQRILKQKEILGGFVSMEQMNDIWGLSPEVVEKLGEQFKVGAQPQVKKIAINDASVRELSQFPYFRYRLSKDIVTYRSMNGGIKSADDLKNIKNFPIEKIPIIAVYLEF